MFGIRSSHINRPALRLVAMLTLVISAFTLAFPSTVGAQTFRSSWPFDTGVRQDWNGGCQARATGTYYPANDQVVITTTVTSPYLFAACRVKAQVWVRTAAGEFPSAVHYTMACGVLDASCASTQTSTGSYVAATPGLTAYVDSVNATLSQLGYPATFSRQQAVTGVRVTFAKA
jgi:hypothetical protein